ncbi:MAG TPA: hypothetical protein VIM58_05975, partial [Candidatus Methylacidiphilales bacterium]
MRKALGKALEQAGKIAATGTWTLLLFLLTFSPLPLRAVDIETTPPPTPQTPPPAPTPAAGLTLEECYQEALLNNAKIRSARANFEGALGAKIILQSVALPTLTAQFLAGGQKQFGVAHPRIIAILNSNFYQPLFNAAIPPSFRQGRAVVAFAEQDFYVTA